MKSFRDVSARLEFNDVELFLSDVYIYLSRLLMKAKVSTWSDEAKLRTDWVGTIILTADEQHILMSRDMRMSNMIGA